MDDIPLGGLLAALIALLALSAFFSGSETALMTLNRYRMQHLAQQGKRSAILAQRLLEKPDRLIGIILLGNNFVNTLASSVVTLIAIRTGGESAIAIAAGVMTLLLLIFSEVAPKTLGALKPEALAYPAAMIYTPLLKITYPLVWTINLIANQLLRFLGVNPETIGGQALSKEELRTVVNEASALIPQNHQRMLLNILDLENAKVEDIMTPRHEIDGIDLDEPWDDLLEDLHEMPYTQAIVYRGSMDNILGFIHTRKVMQALMQGELNEEILESLIREPYFVPAGTTLYRQLINFQHNNRRSGLVVDEYGDLMGLVTIKDVLEQVIGQFTSDPTDRLLDVTPQEDGSLLVDGGANLRELSLKFGLKFPLDGPNTLNGLILERLENIPEPGTSLLIEGYPVEVLQTQENAVRTARIYPKLAET